MEAVPSPPGHQAPGQYPAAARLLWCTGVFGAA